MSRTPTNNNHKQPEVGNLAEERTDVRLAFHYAVFLIR